MSYKTGFLLFLLILRRAIASTDACQFNGGNNIIVTCNAITFAQFPSLGPNVTKLLIIIENSNFPTISKSTFSQYENQPIEYLELNNDKIKNISPGAFSMLKNLESLTLYGNELEAIPKNAFNEELKKLSLRNNHIQQIDSDALSLVNKLTYLNLRQNLITTIERESFKLPNLDELHLSENKISFIDKDAFLGLHSLTELYLERNSIQELDPGVFRDLGSLRYLKLYENRIKRISEGTFDNLKHLRFLDLSHNKLKALRRGHSRSLSSLEDLDLSSNLITKLGKNIFNLPKLIKLNLESNKISHINKAFLGIHIQEQFPGFYQYVPI